MPGSARTAGALDGEDRPIRSPASTSSRSAHDRQRYSLGFSRPARCQAATCSRVVRASLGPVERRNADLEPDAAGPERFAARS